MKNAFMHPKTGARALEFAIQGQWHLPALLL